MADATVVLLREPWPAVARRLAVRTSILAAGVLLVALPGVWPALRVLGVVLALVGLLFLGLTAANVARNRRVLLASPAPGVIERPASVQEGWLGRAAERVEGPEVEVTTAILSVVSPGSDPRVTLVAGDGRISEVPLWGMAAGDFVAQANASLAARGPRLTVVEPPPGPAEPEG
ncbi:hypothetical protein [Demequina sp. NBRC 110056]|uniref:hypothetical protein n=1 Tax=Demequina sp. NBRC 110056 TaxID=1570345 RepID=UPI0009FED26E|nr:hypothetical protein [Demequina sp. NBRC 110056]